VVRKLLVVVVPLLLVGSIRRATAQVAPADSLRQDTVLAAVPDTVRMVDTVDPVRPFFPTTAPFGSIVPSTSPAPAHIVSELDLAATRYFTAFDAIRRSVPALPLSQGLPGLVRAFSYAGASPAALAASYDGRPLDGLAAYGYDLELYPMEYLERAEIVTGVRALVYGTGEALMAVNFTQPRFDVEGSYSRLWYAQDAGDMTGGDLMYARNIGRHANLALGFRRLSTGTDQSAHFENQSISNWSLHGNATWRVSPSLMLSLTELFNDASRGQNGGLMPGSLRSPLVAEVFNPVWAEQTLRHDVTLAAEWIVGGRDAGELRTLLASGARSGRLDSAIRIDASAYLSYGRREITDRDSVVELDGAPLRTERTHLGVRTGVWIPLAFARLEANAVAELVGARDRGAETSTYDLGRRQAGLMLELPVGAALALRAGARYSAGADGTFGGAGAELVLHASPRFEARVGARLQQHDCPCEDPMLLSDSIPSVRFDAYRTAMLAEAGVSYDDSLTLAAVTAFARRTEPLDGAPVAGELLTGAELRARVPLWWLALEAQVHALVGPQGDRRFPELRAFGDLYAPLDLLGGGLKLRVGTTLEWQSPSDGALYDIATGSFAFVPDGEATGFRSFPLWDAYAQARIGTAYLRLAMRNILDVEQWTIYRYPERGRSVVFEVTWSFID
jgi:outer membrane receptor protein involved in Fe transport